MGSRVEKGMQVYGVARGEGRVTGPRLDWPLKSIESHAQYATRFNLRFNPHGYQTRLFRVLLSTILFLVSYLHAAIPFVLS